MPRLSIVEVAPFAAISSRAVRASDGSSAISAGRNSVEQTPTTEPATKTMLRSIHQRAGRRDDERRRSEQHEAEEESLAPEAIAERRGERRDRGRREQPQQAGDADGRGATVAVREHAERDEVRPLRRHQRAPGQLGAANVDVASGDVECAERLARTRREEPQPDVETGRDARVSEPRFTMRP